AVAAPLSGTFGPWTVHAPPPPESGISLLQILAILDGALDPDLGPLGGTNAATLAAALDVAADQRARYLSDPAFVPVPVAAMLAEAAAMRHRLRPESRAGIAADGAASPGADSAPGDTPGETTSVVVADGEGLVIAMNHSLVSHGGSGVVTDGLGFLYNNTMAGFDVEPGGHNSIEPGRARWSAACPTIVTSDVDSAPLRLAMTGPGGSRAIGAVAQGVLDVLAFGLDPLHAVSLPRIDAHDGMVDLESAVPSAVEAGLRDAGMEVHRTFESGFAALYAVARTGGKWQAAADPRRPGAAITA
ncbi:MAG: hypothetical protein E6I94_10885, partial [Chloroflexi bacterium]